MIPARKKWGQHFLVSAATAEKIVDAAGLGPDDVAFEVGPGDGALTRPLSRRAGRVLAVEIDPLRAAILEKELGGPRLRVLQGDVLERPFSDWLARAGWSGPAVLVANLPYNVATPILSSAIAQPETIRRCLATVQKEVAARFAAKPGSKSYGYLSVRSAAFSRARVLFDLPPGAFRPRPRVTSSVLDLVPRTSAIPPGRRDRALAIASLGFRSRRKTLPNALASAGGRERWEGALRALGLDPRSRAEVLSLEDFLALADSDAAEAVPLRSAEADAPEPAPARS